MSYTIEPVAVIRSPFREKFATPRQPGLTPSLQASIEFIGPYADPNAISDLKQFSHIWLLFLFDQNWDKGWTARVRPPRLGGNKRVGVFATRSPFRPNPIGLSAVKLIDIDCRNDQLRLIVEGADLVDGTPIIDIKPYIPYSDSIPSAAGGFADGPPPLLEVCFTEDAQKQLLTHANPQLFSQQIREVLSLDPRPAYRRTSDDGQEYGVLLENFNIRWQVVGEQVLVTSLERITG